MKGCLTKVYSLAGYRCDMTTEDNVNDQNVRIHASLAALQDFTQKQAAIQKSYA